MLVQNAKLISGRMTVLLEGNTDAQKSGTRSIKRVYQKMKNKNNQTIPLNENVFRKVELILHTKNANLTTSIKQTA